MGRQSYFKPDSLAPTMQVHAFLLDRGRVLSVTNYSGPHKSTYGAAWLRQLADRGINVCVGCRRLDRGELDDCFWKMLSFHLIISSISYVTSHFWC
jgi:hypothetical protein